MTGSVLMGANDRCIEHDPFEIGILEHLEDGLPSAFLGPSLEAFVDGVVFAEALGQVFPGRAGAGNPEHGIDEEAVISGISAWFAGLSRQKGLDAFEVFVGDSVAVHGRRIRFKSPVNDLNWMRVPASVNFSFVHTT